MFLYSEITYDINTYLASFTGEPLLKGYVGHHAYIKINIEQEEYLIEFNIASADTSCPPSQTETRKVTGAALIDMIAYHRKLQETDAATRAFIATRMKPGEVDCYSYINKVLIGTNQESLGVVRYKGMTPIGAVIGKFSDYLSPFSPGFFHTGTMKPVVEDGPAQQPVPAA